MNFIYKTVPRHTEEDVMLDQQLEIYFMIDMNKNSITESDVVLFNLTEQKTEPVDFQYQNRVLKIQPIQQLSPKSHYQLQLVGGKNGIKDITGRTMFETYEVEFHTKDVKSIKPPRILSPTNISVVQSKVEIILEPVNGADYYELEVSTSNTFHNLVWPKNNEVVYNVPEIKIIPDIEYEERNYYVRVRSVDEEGQKSAWSDVIQFYLQKGGIIQPENPIIPEEEEGKEDLHDEEEAEQEESENEEPTDEEPNEENNSSEDEGNSSNNDYQNSDEDSEENQEDDGTVHDENEQEEDENYYEVSEDENEENEDGDKIPENEDEDKTQENESDVVVVLSTNSRIHPSDPLLAIQEKLRKRPSMQNEVFSIIQTSPSNKSVHVPLDRIQKIIIEFDDDIDPSTVDETTCYLLVERN